jgi:hypothetical protein
MNTADGKIANPASNVGIAELVLHELLTGDQGAHQRPEHDEPAGGGDPEHAAVRNMQVMQRRGGALLAEHEGGGNTPQQIKITGSVQHVGGV